MSSKQLRIVMIGATGAVGGITVRQLINSAALKKLTLLGRSAVSNIQHDALSQHQVDLFKPDHYSQFLSGHDIAICTFGVGEPSKISREEFVRIDHDAVLAFAKQCKAAGIQAFHLLASVDADARSRSYYLRVKGQLCDAIAALDFERFCIIAPSMILTPSNRYGFIQGVLLKAMPLVNPILLGGLKRYRGIAVQTLGKAIAANVLLNKSGVERLHWAELIQLGS